MSETPVSGNPDNFDLAEGINDALAGLVGCIASALPDICSVGLTIGETYIPFRPDEDEECGEDEEFCAQAWVRVTGAVPKYENEQSFEHGGCGSLMSLSLEIGVLRCFDTPEDGEAPTATEVMAGTFQSMADMRAVYCAAMNCEEWDSIESGTWLPMGPLGGQYGGVWTFDVEPKP